MRTQAMRSVAKSDGVYHEPPNSDTTREECTLPDLALQKQVEMDVGQLQRDMPPPSAPPAHAEVYFHSVSMLSFCLHH